MQIKQFTYGGIYTIAGILLLLGYFAYGVDIIVILVGVGLIVYGLHLMDAYRMAQRYVKKTRQSHSKASGSESTQHQNKSHKQSMKRKKTSKNQK